MSNYDDLIKRLKERAYDPKRNTSLGVGTFNIFTGLPSYPIHPPLSSELIAEAEAALGFEIPPLLRHLYLEVGNGGWGPGYGFYPLVSTAQDYASKTLVQVVENEVEEWKIWEREWPKTLLPLCDMGCRRECWIDCSHSDLPVIFTDPECFRYFNNMIANPVDEIKRVHANPQQNLRTTGFCLWRSSLEAELEHWAAKYDQ